MKIHSDHVSCAQDVKRIMHVIIFMHIFRHCAVAPLCIVFSKQVVPCEVVCEYESGNADLCFVWSGWLKGSKSIQSISHFKM